MLFRSIALSLLNGNSTVLVEPVEVACVTWVVLSVARNALAAVTTALVPVPWLTPVPTLLAEVLVVLVAVGVGVGVAVAVGVGVAVAVVVEAVVLPSSLPHAARNDAKPRAQPDAACWLSTSSCFPVLVAVEPARATARLYFRVFRRSSSLHLSGEARHEWEHSIAPMEEARWSLTFRSFSGR